MIFDLFCLKLRKTCFHILLNFEKTDRNILIIRNEKIKIKSKKMYYFHSYNLMVEIK